METNIQGVKITWESIWGKKADLKEWNDLSQLIYEILKKQTRKSRANKILEAGSGTGRISLRLATNGNSCLLIDISKNAIRLGIKTGKKIGTDAFFMVGDIRSMPFKDDVFDVVWNAGVLEHFEECNKFLALAEMLRVGRNVITLNPYDKALIYKIGKYYAERTGHWKCGYEKPIKSLNEVLQKGNVDEFSVSEYSVGFLEQFDFLANMPLMRYVLVEFKKVKKILWKLNHLPGYLLVTVIRK